MHNRCRSGPKRWPARFARGAGGLLLGLGLSGHATPAVAQVNRFLTRDDSNQVPQNTAKSGNVIPNDDNPDNLGNFAFNVTQVAGPANGAVALNADGSYVYTPAAGYLGADSFTYQICQPGATPACSNTSTVRLNVYDPAVACTLGTGRNLLQNPSFTLGNVGFSTSSYVFVPTPTSVPNLYQEGTYAVASDANPYHNSFSGTGRTGAGDNFMVVNGAAALVAVYSQTVTVLPNRYYSFSVYATSVNPGSPAQLGLVVDGKSTSVVTTLPAVTGTYVQFSDLYFSGPGPAGGFPVTIEIRDVNKSAGGNDFGLDDVYFGSCSAFLLADTKTTAPMPNVPVPAAILPLSATISAGGSIGVTVASFTVQSLPPTGTLTYNGAAVTVGQVIPVASPGSVSSGGTLTYTPAGGCTGANLTFTYFATDSDGANSSNTATYTIPVVPVAATPIRVRGPVPFCPGEQARLSAGSRPGYRFTWYNGGAVVNGAGAVLNDSVFVATAAGSYTVRVELAGCSATSPPLSVTVLAPVTAGSIGANQTICPNAVPVPLTSTVGAAGGTGTYTYQWEVSLNGTTWAAVPGATGATYTPVALTATTSYRRQVTSGTGTCAAATSNVVTLTVPPAVVAGRIGANQSLCTNTAPARLTSLALATGGIGTYAYQWESSLDNITWNDVPGATASEYTPGPLTATTYFRRRVTSGTGTCAVAYTAEVALTVPPALVAGLVGSSQTVCANTVPAPLTGPPATGGLGTYTYQWQSSLDNVTWVNLTGATGLGYAPGLLTTTTAYRRQVTSGTGTCATAVSNVVTLTVTPAPVAGVALASPPAQCTGSALTFTPTVTNGGPAPAFRWFVNNVLAAATPTFTAATLADNDQVRVELTPTPGLCLAGTPTATVVVRVVAVVTPAVSIRALGTGGPACAGTALSFGVDNATGAGLAPQYQWLLNGVPVPGSTGPTFASATLRDNDRLRLQLTSSASCARPAVATSNELVISLRPDALPTLSITGPGATCTGTAAAFNIAASTAVGTAPAYQWRVDGSDVAGATGAAFSSAALRDGQLVTLAVRTATACGQPATAVSNAVRATITPVVDVDAGPDKEVVEGESVVLEGTANGTYPVEWTPAQDLSFAAGNRLRPVASPTVTTVYTLSAGTSGCEDVSRVTVRVLPAIRIPNAFTPNRDGDDDTWEIDRIGNFAGNTVTVFNRWGGQVFKTTNYGRTNEWGGDVNGQPAPVGTYYYVITLGNGKTYSGPLTVVY